MAYIIGLDIGGTKIAAILMTQQGEIKYRAEVKSDPTDKEAMFQQVIKGIEKLLEQTKTNLKEIHGIGIGVPGKVDRKNGIAIYQNNLPWRHFPIVKRLKDHFPIDHIVIDNDVYLAAWAEWRALGEKKNINTFVYVTISTGISCAIIQDDKFIRGNGFAGELGLIPVINHSDQHLEKLESVASGPAIAQLAQKVFQDPTMTPQKLFSAYKQNDPRAIKVINDVLKSLAQGVYAIISLLDPQQIVFGGGIVNNNPFIIELLKEHLQPYVIPEQLEALHCLSPSVLKENSGAIGAAWEAYDL